MAYCKFCGEQDESSLIMSSRLVHGEVETIEICLRCFWLDKFRHEAEGEDGKAELRNKEKICGSGERDSQQAGAFLFPEGHTNEIFCDKDDTKGTKAL